MYFNCIYLYCCPLSWAIYGEFCSVFMLHIIWTCVSVRNLLSDHFVLVCLIWFCIYHYKNLGVISDKLNRTSVGSNLVHLSEWRSSFMVCGICILPPYHCLQVPYFMAPLSFALCAPMEWKLITTSLRLLLSVSSLFSIISFVKIVFQLPQWLH